MISMRMVASIAGAALTALVVSPSAEAQRLKEREFEFTYVAELTVPEGAERLQMWLPYPQRDDHQDIRHISIEAPIAYKMSQEFVHRNSILFLSAETAELESPDVRVEVKFKVTRREQVVTDYVELEDPMGGFDARARAWLGPDSLVPLDDVIRGRAEEIIAGKTTVVEKAQAIYDYTVDNLTYDRTGTGWGRGDIYYACDTKRGNCTDFHAVFIGFARAVGIPAKFEIGFPVPAERGEGEIEGYHCWAEFYVPGFGWVPVDTSEANLNPERRDYYFGALDENRVQFTVGRDLQLNPHQAGGLLNFFIYPYAEIDGKKVANIERHFYFKDLGSPTE